MDGVRDLKRRAAPVMFAAVALCVAIPSHVGPTYFVAGQSPPEVRMMVACNVTPPGWRPMSSAPRDGTVVEIRNAFGLLPTYGIYHWAGWGQSEKAWVDAKPRPACKDPSPVEIKDKNGVVNGWSYTSTCFTTGFTEDAEPGLAWRPLTVAPSAYVEHNPTTAEWRRAAGMRP